jgi:hypothetical protein
MSYTINRWDNATVITTVQDGTVDQTLDIQLVGKNYAGYGEIQNETFVHMLENFARQIPPPNAISGQLWYDTTNKKLKVHTGDVSATAKVWKTLTGAEYSATEPPFPTPGDLWFDSNKDQLKVRIGGLTADWLTVGPQNAGTGITQMVSRNVVDANGTPHGIIAATVNGAVNFIISEDEFVLNIADPDSTIVGFTDPSSKQIKRGITFPNVDAVGISGTNGGGTYRVWGTASNALRFGGKLPAEYLSPVNNLLTLPYQVKVSVDEGITLGANDDLKIEVIANQPQISARLGGQRITFSVKQNTTPVFPLVIDQFGVRPDLTSSAFNLGSTSAKWATVYATNFDGTATQANALKVGTSYLQASFMATNSGDTLVARKRNFDGTSTISATTFEGNANTATVLKTPRNINGKPFDGSGNISIEYTDLVGKPTDPTFATVTLTGAIASDQQAVPKSYVDAKFGVGGILGIAAGGTNASTDTQARANLKVPRTDGVGVTPNSTWNINIAPTAVPISLTNSNATLVGTSGAATATTIVVSNVNTVANAGSMPTGNGYDDLVSVTTNTVGSGSKTWTVQKVPGWQVNDRIRVTKTQSGDTITMAGKITAIDYIALTITVLVDTFTGSGISLAPWSFQGLADWRVGAKVAGTAITGTVTITAIVPDSPALGQQTLTVAFPSQTVAGAGSLTIVATDNGNGIGGNAATATRAKNISDGSLGDIPYQIAANTTNYLSIGAAGYVLSSTGTVPEWKNLAQISVGSSAQILVADKPTDVGTFYPIFVTGGLPGTGSQPRSIYADQTTFSYDTNQNKLTLGDGVNGYGTVIARLNGDVLSPNGTVVLSQGTGAGTSAYFTGKAATADKLQQARAITLGGILKGTQSFDGSGAITINAEFADNFQLSTGSLSGNYVGQLTAGNFVTLNEGVLPYVPGGGDNVTIGVNASSSNVGSSIVSRNSSGNFSANEITADKFIGIANEAYFADLAEKYLPDAEYEVGTVLTIGGEKEVTASAYGDLAIGVVSDKPAYLMNKDLEGGVAVALKGRVPVKVIGAVRKGQRLVATDNGCAVAAVPHANDVFAIALESSNDTGVKVIEAFIR